MSMSKIIIFFIIILLIFGGVVVYQYSQQQMDRAEVTINDHTFRVDVASTAAELQEGLSGRDSLPEDEGMLFLFEEAEQHSFWMNEMNFPIDIIFIRENTIVSIEHNAPAPESDDQELPIYQPSEPIDKVLEINAGLSKEYNFQPGDEVMIQLSDAPASEEQ